LITPIAPRPLYPARQRQRRAAALHGRAAVARIAASGCSLPTPDERIVAIPRLIVTTCFGFAACGIASPIIAPRTRSAMIFARSHRCWKKQREFLAAETCGEVAWPLRHVQMALPREEDIHRRRDGGIRHCTF
jgi:hypothetical protein